MYSTAERRHSRTYPTRRAADWMRWWAAGLDAALADAALADAAAAAGCLKEGEGGGGECLAGRL